MSERPFNVPFRCTGNCRTYGATPASAVRSWAGARRSIRRRPTPDLPPGARKRFRDKSLTTIRTLLYIYS